MDVLKPLFITPGYLRRDGASNQIARIFWENQSEKDFLPTMLCAPANFDFNSRWRIIEIKDRNCIERIGGVFNKIGLPGLGLMPDMYFYSWAKFVMWRIPKILQEVDFNYIHTLSFPASTHLIGLKLKQKTGKPWLVQFNDPWTDSSERQNHKPNFTERVDRTYERRVVENADLILHTNHILADIWIERYGDVVKDKMFVMPLNFNIYPLPEIEEQDNCNCSYGDKLNVAHIGGIYSTRSSVDFLKGVAMLIEQHPETKEKIHIAFVGGVKKEEMGLADNLGINDIVEYIPRLAPEQLANYYISSDIFLAIDVNEKRGPSFPSKLMMYYYYRKPILGITNPNSILEEELQQSSNTVCYYGHPEQIAEYLYQAVTDFRSLTCINRDYWKQYTIENVTSIYKSMVLKMLKNKENQ